MELRGERVRILEMKMTSELRKAVVWRLITLYLVAEQDRYCGFALGQTGLLDPRRGMPFAIDKDKLALLIVI